MPKLQSTRGKLNFDGGDFLHRHETYEDHERGADWHADPRPNEHFAHVTWVHQEDHDAEANRHSRDDVSRKLHLGGEHLNLALDPDSLANRVPDRGENLGQVSTDLVLNVDGGNQQVEIF